jgi:pSer/pThr/pTyr-binding forkhead associated (FHA) protein
MLHISIQDKGSQNGTYVNEERLSEVKYATYLYNTRQKQPEWYIYVNEERLSEVKYTTYLYNTRHR